MHIIDQILMIQREIKKKTGRITLIKRNTLESTIENLKK